MGIQDANVTSKILQLGRTQNNQTYIIILLLCAQDQEITYLLTMCHSLCSFVILQVGSLSNRVMVKPAGQLKILHEAMAIFIICIFRLSFSFIYALTFVIWDVMDLSFVNLVFGHFVGIGLIIEVYQCTFGMWYLFIINIVHLFYCCICCWDVLATRLFRHIFWLGYISKDGCYTYIILQLEILFLIFIYIHIGTQNWIESANTLNPITPSQQF